MTDSSNTVVVIRQSLQQEHKFVNGMSSDLADATRTRREVRSHVAKISANRNAGTRSAARGRPKRHRGRSKNVIWQIHLEVSREPQRPQLFPLRPLPSSSVAIPATESRVARLPFVALVIDNYLENLAVAVPELDGPNNSLLLRKAWFPMVLHSPIIFQVIVLFSASHYAAQQHNMNLAAEILHLKQLAISSLKEAVRNAQGCFRDVEIAAAAKMASYEAIYGTEAAYHAHMKGLTEMVNLRGGLSTLGLDGFLARLLMFIDTNAAFLLNCTVHFDESSFPKQANPFLPNPGQFIGAS